MSDRLLDDALYSSCLGAIEVVEDILVRWDAFKAPSSGVCFDITMLEVFSLAGECCYHQQGELVQQ